MSIPLARKKLLTSIHMAGMSSTGTGEIFFTSEAIVEMKNLITLVREKHLEKKDLKFEEIDLTVEGCPYCGLTF